ncbi:MAG: ABC transporter ATP-binding protein [Phycisphaeraceae bacterium]|nr:ABC transporter ATP-binding protein [Phycisphaeraceae bacterium]
MLRLDDIRKAFGPTVAVDGLSLRVAPGEVLGLLGPNGAGKTTTMSIATGLLPPDAGSVDIDGAGAPTAAAVRRRLGLAPQAIALYDDLSARENLLFFASLYAMPRAEAARRADELLELVALRDRRHHRVKGFSGGMKRRLNLAAAIVHDPPLVLLDEPTAGVDPQSRHAILELVGTLRSAGKTVIYSTHYMEEAQRICDRVAIIDHGRVLAIGSVASLVKSHGGKTFVVIEDPEGPRRVETADPVREIARLLEGGLEHPVRLESPNLESVFLDLTGRSLRD